MVGDTGVSKVLSYKHMQKKKKVPKCYPSAPNDKIKKYKGKDKTLLKLVTLSCCKSRVHRNGSSQEIQFGVWFVLWPRKCPVVFHGLKHLLQSLLNSMSFTLVL